MQNFDICEIVGKEYILIEEGEYEVVLKSWETSSRYSRKDPNDPHSIKGGKLYLWFRIDPYSQILEEEQLIFMALNVDSLLLPLGENGKFRVGARSKYYKMLKRLFGKKAPEYAKSPKKLAKKVFIAKVRTVKVDGKQKNHHENEWYSVIDDLVDLG